MSDLIKRDDQRKNIDNLLSYECCSVYRSTQNTDINLEPQEIGRAIYINNKHNPNMQEMLYITKEETSVYIRFKRPNYTYSRWYKNVDILSEV